MLKHVKYLFLSGVFFWLLGFAALAAGLDKKSDTFLFLPMLLSACFFIACVAGVMKEKNISLMHQLMMVISIMGIVVILFMFFAMFVFSA